MQIALSHIPADCQPGRHRVYLDHVVITQSGEPTLVLRLGTRLPDPTDLPHLTPQQQFDEFTQRLYDLVSDLPDVSDVDVVSHDPGFRFGAEFTVAGVPIALSCHIAN